ncbi:MAG: hypothetical protein ACTSV2_03855 [Candidatus Thorarchaeota archaeon]
MSEQQSQIDTIFDRPGGLRFIGLTQMLFGLVGLIAAASVAFATWQGNPTLQEFGYVYSILIFAGVALPGLIIGNYVDDLRRSAVVAQVFYSLIAIGLTGGFLFIYGRGYQWTFPLFETTVDVLIGNLAGAILTIQAVFVLYLLAKWKDVAPPSDVVIIRDRDKAGLVERGIIPSPLASTLLASDGTTLLTKEEGKRVLDVRKLTTDEGIAILCSNCGGATPLTKAGDDNTIQCEYCGVLIGISGVIVSCKNHAEFLAATTCAVCGDYYCRRCLTAQEPPVDERWEGSVIFLCQSCFEGRYRPAVTTSSLVIPIEDLFGQAGGRFSKIGGLYKKFLGKYAAAMKWVLVFALQLLSKMGKSGGGRRGGGGGKDSGAAILVIILIIIAIPVLVFIGMLIAGIVIIPLLFYMGLIGVAIEAVKIMRHTDFVSLETQREKGMLEKKEPRLAPPVLRDSTRSWESTYDSYGKKAQGVDPLRSPDYTDKSRRG